MLFICFTKLMLSVVCDIEDENIRSALEKKYLFL